MPPVNGAPPPPPPGGHYQGYPNRYGEPVGEARAGRLRRLSKLTWRATQLSVVSAVGFAAFFAHSAPATTVTSTALAKPSPKASTPCPRPPVRQNAFVIMPGHPPRLPRAPAAAVPGRAGPPRRPLWLRRRRLLRQAPPPPRRRRSPAAPPPRVPPWSPWAARSPGPVSARSRWAPASGRW